MTIEITVGEKIKQIREMKKVSLEELASRSGMDITTIQKIEQEKNIPSLAPLVKIARALGVRLGTFLDDSDSYGPVVVRSGEYQKGARFTSQSSETREHLNFFSLAFDKAGRNMEPFIVEIEPGQQSDYMLSSHEGEEFIYVLEGEIEINYGKELYRLAKGDSIYLDSIVLHNVHAGNSMSAKILAVVYAPF
ncbi:transcriptional regulator, MerR family [Aquipluma nitroreducens]|uniref:Transcriptional regulator, MerR family n=1 Tax=Aquipluma nitroreducens TaxID=2010828 RepID=A0A5K7S7H5_9BACT|nr:XRE family transcriptional regulator [Aquipluma nitroreducens]BBE17435.1 transcriptional regulator, MerR family [Aquipluma nitroreducens]